MEIYFRGLDREEVSRIGLEAARRAEAFCREHGQDGKMANHMALCLEEIAGNTVIHGFDPKKDK